MIGVEVSGHRWEQLLQTLIVYIFVKQPTHFFTEIPDCETQKNTVGLVTKLASKVAHRIVNSVGVRKWDVVQRGGSDLEWGGESLIHTQWGESWGQQNLEADS